MPPYTYHFEGLDEELSRPPLAALRALYSAGVVFSPRSWDKVPIETRRALTRVGGQDSIDEAWVLGALRDFPQKHIEMVEPTGDPPPDELPTRLTEVLGADRPLPLAFWQQIRPLDRRVLVMLAMNRRLFNRALEEISVRHRLPLLQLTSEDVAVTVGHCEVHLEPRVAHRLTKLDVLEGHALLLASTAGVRAARSAAVTLGLHGETRTGVVEVGSEVSLVSRVAVILWQAHVSTTEGAFYPAASLLAAVTAATALHAIVTTELDGDASISAPTIADEPWRGTELDDAPTVATND